MSDPPMTLPTDIPPEAVPFLREAGYLERLYRTYGERAAFLYVYIHEAHPTDGWQVESNVRDHVQIAEPRALEERRGIALECAGRLGLTAPILLDGMDN